MKGDPRARLDSACRLKASRTASSFSFVIEKIRPVRLVNPVSRQFGVRICHFGSLWFRADRAPASPLRPRHELTLKIEAPCFEEEFALCLNKAERAAVTKLYVRDWLYAPLD